MKIGSYISDLLFQHKKVVLPGFGTFSTKYLPAKFIPEEKVVKPPSKIAVFNHEQKNGDTLLVTHIAQKEGKSHEEVLNYINDFVKETEHVLDAGERLTFDKLGIFYKDTAGELVFEPNHETNYMAPGDKMSEIHTPEQKPPENKDILREQSKEVQKAEEHLAKPKDSEDKTIKEKAAAITSKHKKSTEQKPHELMEEPKKKESKEAKPLPPALKWTAIIIIPLLVILIIVFLNYNFFFGDDGLFRKSEEVVVEQPVEVRPAEIIEEPIVEEVPEPEPKPVPEPEPAFDPYAEPPKADPYRPVYYVVVGSFEYKNNAENLALNLRKEGKRLASVLQMTPTGFHRTYSGFYYDLDEAKTEKEKLRTELREIAWILHR